MVLIAEQVVDHDDALGEMAEGRPTVGCGVVWVGEFDAKVFVGVRVGEGGIGEGEFRSVSFWWGRWWEVFGIF